MDRKPPALARELQYFEKVKTRLKGNRDSYNDMLKCIHLFNQVGGGSVGRGQGSCGLQGGAWVHLPVQLGLWVQCRMGGSIGTAHRHRACKSQQPLIQATFTG